MVTFSRPFEQIKREVSAFFIFTKPDEDIAGFRIDVTHESDLGLSL
jgi:hypothetical protein